MPSYTNSTTKNGSLTDTTVWSAGRVPNATDIVLIQHELTTANGNTLTAAQVDMSGNGNFGRLGASSGTLTLNITNSLNVFAQNSLIDAFDLWTGCVVTINAPTVTYAGNSSAFVYNQQTGSMTITGNVTISNPGNGFWELNSGNSTSLTIIGNVLLTSTGAIGGGQTLAGSTNTLTITGNVTCDSTWNPLGGTAVFSLDVGTTINIGGNVDFSAAAANNPGDNGVSIFNFSGIPTGGIFTARSGNGHIVVGGNLNLYGPQEATVNLFTANGLWGSISIGGTMNPAAGGSTFSPNSSAVTTNVSYAIAKVDVVQGSQPHLDMGPYMTASGSTLTLIMSGQPLNSGHTIRIGTAAPINTSGTWTTLGADGMCQYTPTVTETSTLGPIVIVGTYGGSLLVKKEMEVGTTSGLGLAGAIGPLAGINTGDIPASVKPMQSVPMVASVYTASGAIALTATVSSIVYTIYDLDECMESNACETPTTVTGHSGVSLTPSSVMFDTLQSSALGSAYNFMHTPSVALGEPFPHAGAFAVQYTFTPVSGSVFYVNFKVHARW